MLFSVSAASWIGNITVWVLVIGAVLVLLFDAWAAQQPGVDTISAAFSDLARRHPILPFALGVLIGHLLWPNQR